MVAASRIVTQAGQVIRHRRTRKVALWAGGVVAAIALLGFVIAPPIVKHQLERMLAEKLHRPVAIERVRINPFAPSATVAGLAVMERTGDATAVSFDELHVNLAYSSLWRRAPIVQALRLTRPHVRIVRHGDKTYNFQDLIDELAATPPAPEPAGPPPRFAVFNIEVSDGRIDFDDRLEKETHAVTELRLGVPFISSIPSQVDITVQPALSTKINGAPFSLAGETKPFKDTRETTLHLQLADLQIAKYLEYVPVPLRFRLADGRLDTQLVIKLSSLNEKLHTFTLAGTAAVRQLAMQASDGAPLVALDALQVDLESFDLVGGAAKLKRVAVEAPDVHVVRGKDGRINLLGLVGEAPAAPRAQTGNATGAPPQETGNATAASQQAGNAGKGDAAPFTVSVADVSITGGTVHIVDAVPQRPFEATLTNVTLALSNLALPPATESTATVDLAVGIEPKGRFTYKGALQLAPLHSEGRLTLEGLRLAAFAPYYEGFVNVIVTGGQLTTQGDLAVDVPDGKPVQVAYHGDATVSGFASLDKPTSQELLRWKQLAVSGIDFKLAPLAVAIRQIALADFYSRLIVNNDGTLNLQKILVASAAEQRTTATAADGARAAAPPPAGRPAPVAIGKVVLRRGRINFSDYLIKPNYTADLSQVSGTVSGMTADKAGDVELHAKIGRTAPLEILGKVNPLGANLFVDLTASARDIELTDLTPYAVKYAGYGIERGKLSLKTKYFIEDRKLTAENNIYLDQLTFGARVESPTATKLPVLLAVALLKDRHGVIDIDLPIAGSLDDPQFSIGGVIGRVIVNLITKAVTAPFALLGRLVGGGEELAYVEFAPGTARLAPADEAKLESLAKALHDRPALKLDVSGRIDPPSDREGLKRVLLERQLKALKLRQTAAKQADAEALDDMQLDQAEYARYLAAAYREAKFEKPRNALGFAKNLPAAEMEQLMLAHVQVSDEELRHLANARAQAVKAWLVENGKVAGERVFLLAPRVGSEGIKDQGKPTRVDFAVK